MDTLFTQVSIKTKTFKIEKNENPIDYIESFFKIIKEKCKFVVVELHPIHGFIGQEYVIRKVPTSNEPSLVWEWVELL